MRKIIIQIIVFIVFLFTTILATAATITDYQQTFFPGYDRHNHLQIVIRSYYRGKKQFFLAVNPYTFTTSIIPAIQFNARVKNTLNAPGYYTMQKLQLTPYMHGLWKYTKPSSQPENTGVIHAEQPTDSVFLTVDMCPSTKPFEEKFFHTLVQLANQSQHPIPLSLSATGLWINTHPNEFNWLLRQIHRHKLAITWINHSFSHVYYADLANKDNFLLTEQTNLTFEILATEKILLEHGQLPSVFFRAPGLVTNENVLLKLRKFGLIPVGSDAWLAKNEVVKNGSIILVHGNSNEHLGIQLIMPMLQQKALKFLPLSQAFAKPL
jgi:peptidoglycan/xylan/chitin deacetylase (PgdA/CDA1 family)